MELKKIEVLEELNRDTGLRPVLSASADLRLLQTLHRPHGLEARVTTSGRRAFSGSGASVAVLTVCLAGMSLLAAGPTTTPSMVPATQPAVMPQNSSPQNSNNSSRRDRNSRRGRGNRDSSAAVVLAADPYAILDTRSIFIKGDQRTAGSGPRSTGENASGGIFPNRQASALIFNGVILVNDEALAMVEDSATGTVVKVHAGDQISGGKVTGITFGDLAYEANGQMKHVEIGQNLEGRAPSNDSYSSATTAAPTSMSAGGAPAGGGVTSPPGSSTSGMSPDDILAKLKARRAAESGGK